MGISSIRREAEVRRRQRWYSQTIPSGNRVPVTLEQRSRWLAIAFVQHVGRAGTASGAGHRLAAEPPSPRGPWLFQGSLRLASSLTPSSAASLGPSVRLPYLVIRAAFAIRDSLGWDRDLPPFTTALSHHAILLRPRGSRQVRVPSSSLSVTAFARLEKARPSQTPRFALSTLTGSWWVLLFRGSIGSLSAMAW